MPKSGRICCVVGCSNTYHNTEGKGIKFYSFPGRSHEQERRQKWITITRRINEDGTPWQPTKNSRVCSEHFISKMKNEHPAHPDYVPTVFPKLYSKKNADGTERFHRLQKRKKIGKRQNEGADSEINPPQIEAVELPFIDKRFEDKSVQLKGKISVMSGYRRVNYYELCRLCTSSEGNKIHIFREEGRKRQLRSKIETCLSLQVREDDSMPKNICAQCEEKLENSYSFRESCLDAGKMLTTFFSTIRFSDDFVKNGMVYIRDTAPIKPSTDEALEEETPQAVDTSSHTGKTVIGKQSQSSDVNHVSSTTNKVAVGPKKHATSSSDDSYSYREQIEEQNLALSSIDAQSIPSQVVEVNTSYASFNNGSMVNGNSSIVNKSEESLNNNHVIDQLHVASSQTDANDEHLFYPDIKKRKKKKILLEIDSSDVNDTMQQDIGYQHNQGFSLQLEVDNSEKQSAATSYSTEVVLNRSSETQIGEYTYLDLKTETSMTSMGDENEDSPMQLPDCEMSDRDFGANGELAVHIVSYEGAEQSDSGSPDKRKGVACELCNKFFRRKEHLHQHMKLHTGERPFSCTLCDKSFSRKEHLIRHSVSHTGEKCHSCDVCGKTFSRKDNLYKHKKTHGIAGPYVCEECGKSFVVKHYYLMHQTMHTMAADDPTLFKCDVCDKVFATKQYLKSHRVRHDRGKLHKKQSSVATVAATDHISTTDSDTLSLPVNPSAPPPPPLTTINAQAILPSSNILQVAPPSSSSQPMFQVCNVAGKQTLLMSVASKQLLETFRKINS